MAAKLRGESVVLSPLGLGNRDKSPARASCSRLGAALPGGPSSYLGVSINHGSGRDPAKKRDLAPSFTDEGIGQVRVVLAKGELAIC